MQPTTLARQGVGGFEEQGMFGKPPAIMPSAGGWGLGVGGFEEGGGVFGQLPATMPLALPLLPR